MSLSVPCREIFLGNLWHQWKAPSSSEACWRDGGESPKSLALKKKNITVTLQINRPKVGKPKNIFVLLLAKLRTERAQSKIHKQEQLKRTALQLQHY